jgi:hypothetical protein
LTDIEFAFEKGEWDWDRIEPNRMVFDKKLLIEQSSGNRSSNGLSGRQNVAIARATLLNKVEW